MKNRSIFRKYATIAVFFVSAIVSLTEELYAKGDVIGYLF
jgi:hypothetical protein